MSLHLHVRRLGALFLKSSYHYLSKNISHVRSIWSFDPYSICVFVYLHLCILCQTLGNIVLEVLVSFSFQKYITSWVFSGFYCSRGREVWVLISGLGLVGLGWMAWDICVGWLNEHRVAVLITPLWRLQEYNDYNDVTMAYEDGTQVRHTRSSLHQPVQLCNFPTFVRPYNNCKVRSYNNCKVRPYNKCKVWPYNSCKVRSYNNCKERPYNKCKVRPYNNNN